MTQDEISKLSKKAQKHINSLEAQIRLLLEDLMQEKGKVGKSRISARNIINDSKHYIDDSRWIEISLPSGTLRLKIVDSVLSISCDDNAVTAMPSASNLIYIKPVNYTDYIKKEDLK